MTRFTNPRLYIDGIPDFPTELFIDTVTDWPDESFDYDLSYKVAGSEYPIREEIFDESFNINYLKCREPLVYERFIGLLPSLSLRLFSFTCKKFYIDVLYLRGIEVERLWYKEFPARSNSKTQVAKNGRLHIGFLSTKQEIIPYLSPWSLYVFNIDDLGNDLVIVKSYTRLVVDLYGSNLSFNDALKHFHSGIKFVDFKFHYKTANEEDKFKVEFSDFLVKLNNIEKLRLTLYLTDADNSIVKELKKIIEQWIRHKPVPIKTFYFVFQNKLSFSPKTEIKAVYFDGKLMRILLDKKKKKKYITEDLFY